MNDDRIIELYFERSEDAIKETDIKYGGICRRVAYNILGSAEDSEECVSDTYMRVWKTIPPKRPQKLGAFVAGITRHIALDLFRSVSRMKNGGGYNSVDYDEIAECLPSAENVENEADRNTAVRAIERFLSTLPRRKQIMFIRRYYYCSTYGEIAHDLHISEDNVKMTLRRVREKLREHLEKEGVGI